MNKPVKNLEDEGDILKPHQKHGFNAASTSVYGATLLAVAVTHGYRPVVKRLFPASISTAADKSGTTTFEMTIKGRGDVVEVLLSNEITPADTGSVSLATQYWDMIESF